MFALRSVQTTNTIVIYNLYSIFLTLFHYLIVNVIARKRLSKRSIYIVDTMLRTFDIDNNIDRSNAPLEKSPSKRNDLSVHVRAEETRVTFLRT